jgi:hypothetical protein
MRKPRSRDELEKLYQEQWTFLRRSTEAFDRGESAEAKRLAATLRLLLHDEARSISLLSQLGLKEALFFDTAGDVHPANLAPTFGLTQVRFANNKARYVAPLDRPTNRGVWIIPFKFWWRKVVISVPGDFQLTRADLILIMANQDGGVHVDPGLDERYHRLSTDAALNYSITTQIGLTPLVELERVSVRQIAYEVMLSLIQPRRTIPNDLPASPPLPHTEIVTDARIGVVTQRIVQERPVCPCKSGLSYPECHGRGGVNEGKVTGPRDG